MDNYFLSEVAELIPSFLTSVHPPTPTPPTYSTKPLMATLMQLITMSITSNAY